MACFFCIFHALSFELNFFFDRRFPLKAKYDCGLQRGIMSNVKILL